MADHEAEFLIKLPARSPGQLLASVITQQLIAWGLDKTEGAMVAGVAIAGCRSDRVGERKCLSRLRVSTASYIDR
jgi:hypothetical protein